MGGIFGGVRLHLPTINLAGDPGSILLALSAMSSHIKTKKAEGWFIFQDDEEWRYETVSDFRTCELCNSYAGDINGSQIPVEFPDYARWGKTHVKPGTHIGHPELKPANAPDAYGGCRCNLYWTDYMFTLLNRLDNELREQIVFALLSAGYKAI